MELMLISSNGTGRWLAGECYIGEMRAEIGSKFHSVCHQCLDGWAEWKCVHVSEGEGEVGAEG